MRAGRKGAAAAVGRPDGEIALVNHIGAERGPIAAIEAWVGRRAERLGGWHPQFPWSVIGDWLAERRDLRLAERRAQTPFGLFTLTRIAKS